MDIKEEKQKRNEYFREMERISGFEDTQMPIREFHRQEADRMIRQIPQFGEKYAEYLQEYEWEKAEVFGVAEGKAVQKIAPSGKGTCKKRQEQKILCGFEKKDQPFGEQIGAGIKAELEKGHALRQELAIAGESRENIRFFTAFEEIGESRQSIEAYRQGNLDVREPILRKITARLISRKVTPEWFTPEHMVKSSGELYHTIQEFKYFKRLYEDPVNRPFFDNLPEAEKVLVEERIRKMAEVYEEMFRFQCRNNGVDADSGVALDRETGTAYTAKEVVAATEFTERIRQRDAASRAAAIRGYQSTKQTEPEIPVVGKSRYNNAKWIDSLKLISEHEEAYHENKPLIDLMEQELYRLAAVKETISGDIYRAGIQVQNDVGLKEQYSGFRDKEKKHSEQQQAILLERERLLLLTIRTLLKTGKLGIIKSKDDKRCVEYIKEFQQKLEAPEKAVSGKIDRVTKSWGQRRVEQTNDKEILAGDFYKPSYNSTEQIEYMQMVMGTTYKSLGKSAEETRQNLNEEMTEGRIYTLDTITTRKGKIDGLLVSRVVHNMETLKATLKVPEQEAMNILRKLGTGTQGEHAGEETDTIVREGILEYKQLLYRHLKNLEQRYGKLLTQMHPQDVLQRINLREIWLDMQLGQDMMQYMDNNHTGIKIFNDDNRADQDFKALAMYYLRAFEYIQSYVINQVEIHRGNAKVNSVITTMEKMHRNVRELENGVHEGPALKEGEIPCYAEAIRKKYANSEDGLARAGYDRW